MINIRFLAAGFFLLMTSCAPAIKQYYQGSFFPEDRTYQNKALGFSLTYRGNWEITTDPNDMQENRAYARELHEIGAELLFIGFTVERTQGTRCIVYNKNETSARYAEEIRLANKEQVDEDSGCGEDTINGHIFSTWKYKNNDFYFIDYFFSVDTYNFRVSFWAMPKLYGNFLPVYREIVGTLTLATK
jgi:hypothetical protein